MIERIIDLAEEPARLSVRNGLLVIARESGEVTIPLAEIAVLVVSHPCVTFTQAVLAGLAEGGGIFVASNARHMPAAMMLPLESHFLQAERFDRQARAALPLRKRLWAEIVRAKIKAQARCLVELYGDDAGLRTLAQAVRSGDSTHMEALAARRYWPALFADPNFHREREGDDQNRFLNYGYTVLRALLARAVCAAGLHPSLGLHHHNRYDAFRLVDDLMEPFRPNVDRAVVKLCRARGPQAPLDKEAKAALIGALMGRFTVEDQSRTLFDIAARTAQSLAAVFAGERKELILPDL
jgi:CRISPR-associated protein Cas1